MPNDGNPKRFPENYRQIEGSKRPPAPGVRKVGAADPDELVNVLLRLKPSAKQEEFDRIADFAHRQGLRVLAVDVAESSIVLSGSVGRLSEVFIVDVWLYESPTGFLRGCEDHFHLPAGLAGIVANVSGLIEWELENIGSVIGDILGRWGNQRTGSGTGSYKVLDLIVPTSGPKGPVHPDEFSMVGMYDIGTLLGSAESSSTEDYSAATARLLQNMAASPGAFDKVRVFKCLNSGNTETGGQPASSGTVWPSGSSAPAFAVSIDGLASLVQNNLTPYVVLGFFPAEVSPSGPTAPPSDWSNWQTLIQDFLTALAAALAADPRFEMAPPLSDWWFEVWNEPNFYEYALNADPADPNWYTVAQANYFALYDATCAAVTAWEAANPSAGHIRLGGPAIAYDTSADNPPLDTSEVEAAKPSNYFGKGWMQAFVTHVVGPPAQRCDFLSFHRKSSWDAGFASSTDVDSVVNTADEVAGIAKTAGLSNITIVNNEADMRAGVGLPYLPWMEQNFAAWMTALMIAYDSLSSEYSANGFRFMATSDNQHLELVTGAFDGRRSIMTQAATSRNAPQQESNDLLKVPVYNYYELLRLLGTRHGTFLSGSGNYYPHTDLFHAITVSDGNYITSIFTVFPRVSDKPAPWNNFHYSIVDIPWTTANVAVFEINASTSNAFTAAGGSGATIESQLPFSAPNDKAIRSKQEFTATVTKESFPGGTFSDTFSIQPYEVRVYWITPNVEADVYTPSAPADVTAAREGANVIVTWKPTDITAEPWFYTYQVFLVNSDGMAEGAAISPPTLRAALWIDTAPATTPLRYGVCAVSASNVASAIVSSNTV
jgi:Glycosyl hydrolases family 39